MLDLQYEQGPIRPPSEANSLLVRLTRNCPWNRCLFCPVYKVAQFSKRSPAEIKSDIDAMAAAASEIKELSFSAGCGGQVNRQVVALVQSGHPHLFSLAYWLYQGAKRVFLQDADSLLLPVDQVEEVLLYLKEKFPTIKRVTTYARSRTLLRRSTEDLSRLKQAGLTRIHCGLESGSDRVLKYMEKGVSGEQHIEAGLKVKAANLSLSEYVMPGLGGETYWREHAVETAYVLNRINPDFIRLRTLAVPAGCPLYEKVTAGEFKVLSDDALVVELKLLIENLEGITSELYSDHVLNLFEDLAGRLPDDKQTMLNMLNRYLDLPQKERNLYRLGRRTGYFRSLKDLDNRLLIGPVRKLRKSLLEEGRSVDQFIEEMMARFI